MTISSLNWVFEFHVHESIHPVGCVYDEQNCQNRNQNFKITQEIDLKKWEISQKLFPFISSDLVGHAKLQWFEVVSPYSARPVLHSALRVTDILWISVLYLQTYSQSHNSDSNSTSLSIHLPHDHALYLWRKPTLGEVRRTSTEYYHNNLLKSLWSVKWSYKSDRNMYRLSWT